MKNLIFVDIETVCEKQSFNDLSAGMQPLWLKKAEFIRNENESSLEDLYFEKAGIYAEFGKVICISVGFLFFDDNNKIGARIKALYDDDERLLLEKFLNICRDKADPKRLQLCAHNGKEFDIPYLSRRLLINGIRLPEYLNLTNKKPWEINHIDTMDMWKFGDRKSFTSLDLLCNVLGIDSPKGDIDGSDVSRVYHQDNDLGRIAKYCNQDVLATIQVYQKLRGYHTIPEEKIEFVD